MFSVLKRLYCYARRGAEFEKRCLSVPQRDGVSRLRHESFGLFLQQVSNTLSLSVCVCVCVCAHILVTWIQHHDFGAIKMLVSFMGVSLFCCYKFMNEFATFCQKKQIDQPQL